MLEPTDATLLVDGRPVAPLWVATTRAERARGLLGLEGFEGALLLVRTRSVHTVGMRFALDVAGCDRALGVRRIATSVGAQRLVLPRRRVVATLEAEAGAFARWGLVVGSSLAVAAPGVGCGWEGVESMRSDCGLHGIEVGHDG